MIQRKFESNRFWRFHKVFFLTAAISLAALTSPSYGQPLQWNENGHYYQVRFLPSDDIPQMKWAEARDFAAGFTHMGFQGYLATITSEGENNFIKSIYPRGCDAWVGGFQPDESQEPGGNWQWITGEQFQVTFWDGGEPNNAGGNEDCLQHVESGSWFDKDCNTTKPCVIIEYGDPINETPTETKVEAVPVLGHWGLIVFFILLAGSAVWFIRNRRKTG